MKTFLTRIVKFLVGLLLIPAWLGFSAAFIEELSGVRQLGTEGVFFTAGIIIYLAVYLAGHRLQFLHVLGHEATHALSTLLFRGKVRSIYASRYGGQVTVTRSNFIVTLAPYIIPIYTMILVIFSYIIESRYQRPLFFLIGFTLAHHILSTIDSLKVRQPDITKTGLLFSASVIYITNLLAITAITGLAIGEISFFEFVENGLSNTLEVYEAIKSYVSLFL